MSIARLRLPALITALTAAAVLAGCATPQQPPVALKPAVMTPAAGRIGIAASDTPAPDTFFPGAYCLLCLGVANLNHQALNAHVKTLSSADLKQLAPKVAQELRRRGADVVVLEGPVDFGNLSDFDGKGPGFVSKDYRPLAGRFQVARLLVLQLGQVGFVRSYSGYVPTDVPRATVAGLAYLVDLKTNAYDWYYPLKTSRAAEGNWDEPPTFPGLTNAFHQVVAEAIDGVVADLSRQEAAASAGTPASAPGSAASTPASAPAGQPDTAPAK